jgi:hypothetical protein
MPSWPKRLAAGVWDWAGRADDYGGRLLVLVSVALVVGGGALLLLRSLGLVNTLLALVGALAILLGGFFLVAYTANAYAASRAWESDRLDESNEVEPDAPTTDQAPTRLSIEEVGELGERCTRTSKAIYAFLNKEAMRTDEPKLVAEYRQKFDARVVNLCLDLTVSGLSDNEKMKNAMNPPASVEDIQWIARVLAIAGEGYSAKRLAKYQAQAMKELKLEPIDTAAKEKELEELEELVPFVNEAKSSGNDMTPLAALERWMEREGIPESKRRRMRATTERLLKEIQEDSPAP